MIFVGRQRVAMRPVPVEPVQNCGDLKGRVVTPGGLEPPAYGLGNRRSILLSYGVTPGTFATFRPAMPVRFAAPFGFQFWRIHNHRLRL